MKTKLEQVKTQLEQVKVQLEQASFFNAALPLTNFEIQKYYQNKLKFNDVYSRNNLPKIKNGAYVINLDKFNPVGFP